MRNSVLRSVIDLWCVHGSRWEDRSQRLCVCVLEREMQSFLTVWTWLKSYPICFSTLQSSFVSVSLCWDTYVLVWCTVPSLKIFDLLLLYNLLVQNSIYFILFYFISILVYIGYTVCLIQLLAALKKTVLLLFSSVQIFFQEFQL